MRTPLRTHKQIGYQYAKDNEEKPQGATLQKPTGIEPEKTAGIEPEKTAGIEPEKTAGIEPEKTAGIEPEKTGTYSISARKTKKTEEKKLSGTDCDAQGPTSNTRKP